MDRATLKLMAKEHIKGNIGVLFLITLITAIVSGLVSAIPAVGSVIGAFVVTPALSIALVHIYQDQAVGIKPEVKQLFAYFGEFWPAFKVTFLTGLFTMLWSLLLVIPGIIKAYAYSQSMYILAENPGIGAREALKRSSEMMDGHKMELFVLSLSFLGWILLTGVTFGIAGIWVIPYMQATQINFYNSIKPAVVHTAPVAEPAKPSAENVSDLLD